MCRGISRHTTLHTRAGDCLRGSKILNCLISLLTKLVRDCTEELVCDAVQVAVDLWTSTVATSSPLGLTLLRQAILKAC
eukprot:2820570-Amphidinium_carterae.1